MAKLDKKVRRNVLHKIERMYIFVFITFKKEFIIEFYYQT